MEEDASADPIAEMDPFVVRKGGEETGGDLVRFEFTMYPARDAETPGVDLPHERWSVDAPIRHVHPRQEEHWEVLSGELRVESGGDERTLTEGDDVTLPADVPHRHWNPTAEPARIAFERRPALETEAWAESLYVLAQDGAVDERGVPGLLQLAVVFDEYPETYLASLPVGVQKVGFAVLGAVGRLAGLEAAHTRPADGDGGR